MIVLHTCFIGKTFYITQIFFINVFKYVGTQSYERILISVNNKLRIDMTPDQIFKIRYDELALSLHNQQPEDMLKISQSLRQILVDGDRLLDVVNRERRLKIRFTVGMSVEDRSNQMAGLGLPVPNTHFLAMFPPNEPRQNIKVDNLLSFKVVKHDDNYFSIRDVIKTCCNRLGGVHFGDPDKDDEREAKIRELGVILKEFSVHGAFSLLFIIGLIVVEGLHDLRQKID